MIPPSLRRSPNTQSLLTVLPEILIATSLAVRLPSALRSGEGMLVLSFSSFNASRMAVRLAWTLILSLGVRIRSLAPIPLRPDMTRSVPSRRSSACLEAEQPIEQK